MTVKHGLDKRMKLEDQKHSRSSSSYIRLTNQLSRCGLGEKMLKISWTEHKTNDQVLELAEEQRALMTLYFIES